MCPRYYILDTIVCAVPLVFKYQIGFYTPVDSTSKKNDSRLLRQCRDAHLCMRAHTHKY